METRFLESLIAVAEHGSVSAAARAQGLTATSVTQRLQALEAELATQLVTRVGREIRLTPAGERLLEPARRIVGDIRGLGAEIAEADGHLAGTLRLGAISTALTGLLPAVIERWAQAHPAVELRVSPGPSAALFEGLAVGAYDAVIAVAPPFAPSKSLRLRVLRQEPLVCLVPQASLVDRPRQHSEPALIADLLAQERFIRYDARSWGGRLCEAYLRDRRIQVREFCSLDALEAIALLVERRVGVALVPDWSPPWPAIPSCRKLRISDPAYARTIVLAHSATTRFGRILDALTATLSG